MYVQLMGNRNVTSAQKDLKSVGKRQPCERFLSLRLDRLLDTDRDRHSSPHAYHLRPEYWWHDTSWTPAGRLSDDCRISGVVFTTMWSYRYTRLAERISDSTRRPSVFLVQKAAWIGWRQML